MSLSYPEIENIFNRSFRYALTRKKFLCLFPVLVVCGLLIVFCRALSYNANQWLSMSLAFLPVFLCSGLLLSAGVILTRLYFHEIKGNEVNYRNLINQSVQLLIGISYLTLPLMLTYLLLWTLMGVFHLLMEIPAVGHYIGVLFAFAPFLLVFGSLILSLICLLSLFYITPEVALKNGVNLKLAEDVYNRIKQSFLSNIILFLIGMGPLLIAVGLLMASAMMTGLNYHESGDALSMTLKWFFVMVPFCLLLTPAVQFFFNFATESYGLMHKKLSLSVSEEEAEIVQAEVSAT